MDSQTQVNYKELWTVQLSTRKEYQVSMGQMHALLDKMQQGDMGYFSIDGGGFKVSQIVCWWLDSRQIENQLEAPDKYANISEEERIKGRKKLEEIKAKLKPI